MLKIFILIFSITFAGAACAEYTSTPSCGFDFESGGSTCDNYSGSSYSDEPSYNQDLSCTCQETSPSTTSTQWVPNPSGSGGNYETVTTPGFTRSVPCACN